MGIALAGQAFAGTAASGYKVTDFVTDLPNGFDIGPVGLAFDATNRLYVMDYFNGIIYKFGSSGGAAGTATQVNTVPIDGTPAGLAFSKDGRLYVALQGTGAVIEVNPTTGAVIRTVTGSGGQDDTPGATGIATDPLSGDLFVTELGSRNLVRLSNFSTGTATVTTYATLDSPDGITFAPDGTIYLADAGHAKKVVGTNSSAPHTPTDIATVDTIDGIAVAAGGNGSNPTAIFGNRNDGKITKIDLTKNPPMLSDIVTDGTRGDFSQVGQDGCLYATQTASIIKVTNADGTCSFAPTVAVPILRLTPGSQTAQAGTSVTITATLTNSSPVSGHVVTFTVTGANRKVGTATTNSDGKATFTYTGTNMGQDSVTAATAASSQTVSSNSAAITWTAAAVSPTHSPAASPTATPAATPRVLAQTGGGPPTGGTEPTAAVLLLGIILLAAAGRLVLRRD